MVNEHIYYSQEYDLQLITPDLQRRLEDRNYSHKPIQGTCWYNVLANPLYAQKFAYVSTNIENRHEIIVDKDDDLQKDNFAQSDFVNLVLNLALIDEKYIMPLKVDSNMSSQLRHSKTWAENARKTKHKVDEWLAEK